MGIDPTNTFTHTPHFWEYLTQSELQAVYSLAFIATSSEYSGAYPLAQYLDGGDSSDWVSLTRSAVRYLALEHGYLFTGLRVGLDHRIFEDRVVEPRNMISVMQGKSGKLPIHPLAALNNTLEWVRERIPSFNTEPILGVIADIEESKKTMREELGKEALEEEARMRAKARQEFWMDGREGGWL